ncbi:MAG TPA: glycosyltransferase family 2 protein [Burkholderiales bacterium]|nr:glycosyltransferase family 2 protein [Burkholderiales bacterium]
MKFLPRRAPGAFPQVSVIIGVKNGAATLQRCLESIAAQEFADRETIVVDSASTDGTRELLEEARRQGKVTDYVSEPDGGLYEAWNKGVLRSRGDWICFLGCDDAFHDTRALRHLAGARAERGIVYGLVNRVTPRGAVAEVWGGPWTEWRAPSFAGFMIPHPGSLHHRSIFEERGMFDESYRVAGDYELVLRELLVREPVFVDRVVVDMRFGGMSSRPAAIYRTLQEVQRARAAHGLHGKPARLRQALAAAWIGSWIQRLLGDWTYRWCADLYRLVRGKPRIWTA